MLTADCCYYYFGVFHQLTSDQRRLDCHVWPNCSFNPSDSDVCSFLLGQRTWSLQLIKLPQCSEMCDGLDDLCVLTNLRLLPAEFSLHTELDQLKVSHRSFVRDTFTGVKSVRKLFLLLTSRSWIWTLFCCCVRPLMSFSIDLLMSFLMNWFVQISSPKDVTSWRLRIMTSFFLKVTQTD